MTYLPALVCALICLASGICIGYVLRTMEPEPVRVIVQPCADWDELTTLYQEERGNRRCPKLFARMSELVDEGRRL